MVSAEAGTASISPAATIVTVATSVRQICQIRRLKQPYSRWNDPSAIHKILPYR